MTRFRYRTPALVGDWWPTRQKAILDAVYAGQALRGRKGAVEVRNWTVIEEEDAPSLSRSFS